MTQYIKEVDAVTPSSFVHDFNEIAAEIGPVWMSFDFWVHTADVLAGAFTMDINWLDPTNQTRTINGSTISLGDATGRNSNNQVFAVQRLDGTALWEAASTLIGSAGSSLISYRLMLQKEPVSIPW